MKIALLTADVGNESPNVGDYFITHALEQRYHSHGLLRVPIHIPPPPELLRTLRTYDKLVLCGTNLIGANGTLRSAFKKEHFIEIGKPLVLLGLGAQADLNSPVQLDREGQTLLEYWVNLFGPLSVRDELTLASLHRWFGEGAAVLTGCPSLFLKAEKFTVPEPRHVFCPGPFHYRVPSVNRSHYLRSQAAIYRRLSLTLPTLWLAQEPSDLWFPNVPLGGGSLCAPTHPDIHVKCLTSAQSVLSFRIHPCLIAVSNGVPACLLAVDERTRALARTLGIPYLVFSERLTPVQIDVWFHEQIRDYPWKNIRAKLGELGKSLVGYEKAHGLLPSDDVPPILAPRPLRVATMSDEGYRPGLLGLVENLRGVETNLEMHVLELERLDRRELARRFPQVRWIFYAPGDLWSLDELASFQKKPKNIQAYMAKPRFLRKVLAETGEPTFFSDVDIYYYVSPRSIEASTCVLLFPQLTDQLARERIHGLYNTGLMRVEPGAEAFLDWWGKLVQEACRFDLKRGLFYEQRYLDSAPLRFPEISVYRGRDHNAAAWNLQNFRVTVPAEEPWSPRAGEGVLGSFHASERDALGLYEGKVVCDQAAHFFSPWGNLALEGSFQRDLYFQLARHSPRLKLFMFFFTAWKNRLRLPGEITTWQIAFITGFWGGPVLDLINRLYGWARAIYRKLQRRRPPHVEPLLPVVTAEPDLSLLSPQRQLDKLSLPKNPELPVRWPHGETESSDGMDRTRPEA